MKVDDAVAIFLQEILTESSLGGKSILKLHSVSSNGSV